MMEHWVVGFVTLDNGHEVAFHHELCDSINHALAERDRKRHQTQGISELRWEACSVMDTEFSYAEDGEDGEDEVVGMAWSRKGVR